MFLKKGKRKRDFTPIGTVPSQLECARCGSKLKLLGVVAAVPQMYTCAKCGYRGPVGLEPGLVRLGKMKKV